jgi:chromate reductase, NAD(P)H dehydrogenase (quinone)
MPPAKVIVLVGSPRKESFTRKIVNALIAVNDTPLQFEFADIGKVPLYNQDLDTENPPAEWAALRRQIKPADAVLFATPEYNRSMPGVLKNAIDIASRPYGQSSFDSKPGAVISVSPGPLGGFGANQHVRQCLVFLNVPVMQQPEMYMGGVDKLVNAEGKLTNEKTTELLKKFARAFAAWVDTNRKK